jgi:translocation and assembly module TamA
VEDIESEIYQLGTSFIRLLRKEIQETWFLNYQREDYTLGNETQTKLLLIPGVTWQKVVADSRTRTSSGYKGILEIKGASRDFFSDNTFVQSNLYFKAILSATSDIRFLARTELGSSWVDEFSELPASQRYFTGGDNSVRGFAYKSLGPEDSEGNVVGGNYLMVGSLEAEYFFSRKFSMAAFFDTGNALDNISDPLEQGAGVGVRWHTIIGPVRLDFAKPISEKGDPWRIHFYLGPDL